MLDRTIKGAVYARAGIPEFWVVDVNGRTLTLFRQPAPADYTDIATLAESDVVSPLAAPNAAIPVADLLPPAA
jgi:Uma2 family endonuclease